MSAARLHEAVAAALRAAPGLAAASVFASPPVRSAVPYALVGEAVVADWSTKDAAGFEARVTVELHDAREDGAVVRGLAEAARAAVEAMADDIGHGWRIVSRLFVRQRIVRTRGQWVASVEFRVRVLSQG
ncbi:hypothetical protein COC42_10710 [Sphingomonas spermidinifaciens]|uniref:DUF3168 domain-containing protein n=1 Tax=Sphingomonas spermidinifaciens TaxID=1141889 RepID=A0A2A4B1Z7_9SPHN|nr:DUF3168 domain-containing protein [Sphingomonas spermidinifaciens]PCD01962.1 hypothetical protein COC42_10710 [Sphingomonas spermidinifaciens]